MFNKLFENASDVGAKIALDVTTRFSEIHPAHLDLLNRLVEENRIKKQVVKDE
jgi:hypothetical protein